MFDKWIGFGDDAEETARLLREQSDAVPQALWILRPDGGLLHANRYLLEYTGMSRAELGGDAWAQTIHPDERAGVLHTRAESLARGTDWEYEHRFRRHDGAFRWFLGRSAAIRNERGDIVRWFGSATDIHDLKTAQEELRQSREKLSLALAASGIGAAIYDPRTATARADAQAHRVFGVPAAPETTFEDWIACIREEDVPRIRLAFAALIAGTVESAREEFRVRAAGGWRTVAGRGVVTRRGADGVGTELTLVVQDITERNREKERLEAALTRERAILDGVSDAHIATDADYRIVRVNPAAERINGKPAAAFLGKSLWEEWPALVGTDAQRRYRRVQATGESAHFEHHYYQPGKYDTWLMIDAYPAENRGLHIFYRDITARVRREQSLRRSETRLALALHTGRMGLAEVDIASGTLTLDAVAARIAGYPEERGTFPVGDWLARVEPDDAPMATAEFDTLVTGKAEEISMRYRFRRADGGTIHIATRGTVIRDASGVPVSILAVLLDETQEREEREEYRRTAELLQTVLQSAADPIFVKDRDGRYLVASAESERIFGRSAGEVVGRTDYDLLSAAVADAVRANDRRIMATGNSEVIEERVPHAGRNGEVLLYNSTKSPLRDAAGTITGIVGVARDITEPRRAETALRDTLTRLTYHVENSPLAVIEWDGDWNITTWSKRAEQLFGYTAAEMLGTNGYDWNHIHPDDAPSVLAGLDVMRARGFNVSRNRNRTKDGRVLYCEWYNSMQADEDGEPVSVLSLVLDVTGQVEAQAALAASNAKQTRIAETLQQSLLLTPAPDAFFGWELGMLYEAARDEAQVGGDFYDVFSFWEGQVCLVVGDVTGKGLDAARYTAEVKFVLRAFAQETSDPARTLDRLNDYLYQRLREEREGRLARDTFVAVSVVLLDTRTGEATCAVAGAEPPLVRRARTGTVEELPARGIVLGAMDDSIYENAAFHLEQGDMVLLATDGITEARDSARRFFGAEGIAAVFAAEAEPQAAVRRMMDAARRWADGKLTDDACLLTARRTTSDNNTDRGNRETAPPDKSAH